MGPLQRDHQLHLAAEGYIDLLRRDRLIAVHVGKSDPVPTRRRDMDREPDPSTAQERLSIPIDWLGLNLQEAYVIGSERSAPVHQPDADAVRSLEMHRELVSGLSYLKRFEYPHVVGAETAA